MKCYILYYPGDPTLRGALLEEHDLNPDSDTQNLFLNTMDQNFDTPTFEHLEPPFIDDDYMFSLEQNEGISDLFDIDTL